MKSKLFIVLVIAACLCLNACTERSASNPQQNSGVGENQSSQSSTKSSEKMGLNNSDIHSKEETSMPDVSTDSSSIMEGRNENKQEEQAIFCIQELTWEKEDGSIMELTVSVPKDWNCDAPNRTSTKQFSGEIMFNDGSGQKIAGSLGVLLELKDGQFLSSLENPQNFLTEIIDSRTLTINGKEYHLDITNIGDPLRPDVFVYSYSFKEDNHLINFYFYNDQNNLDNIPIFEAILSSICVSFS